MLTYMMAGSVAFARTARPSSERLRARVAADFSAIFGVDGGNSSAPGDEAPTAVKRVDFNLASRPRSSWRFFAMAVVVASVFFALVGWPRTAPRVATPPGQALSVAGGEMEASPTALAKPGLPGPSSAPGKLFPSKATERVQTRDLDRGHSVASLHACANLEERRYAWCMRPAVLRADKRLRTAYDHAVDARVNRRLLLSSRSRWFRLRGSALDDPEAVIDGYDRIGQRLRLEADKRR